MEDSTWKRLKGYELGFKDGQKDGCRAALEWIKSHGYITRFSPTKKVEDSRDVILIETRVIDEELKDGNQI